MKRYLPRLIASTFLLVGSAEAVGLDATLLRDYGGRYSNDCADATAPSLQVNADSLVVQVGSHRMSGTNVEVSFAPFGMQTPTPGEQVIAIISEVRGGHGLTFWLHLDRTGQYIELEGDPGVAATLGKNLLAQRFRDCNTARSQHAVAQALEDIRQAAAENAQQAAQQRSPDALRFKKSYRQALGVQARKEPWLLTELPRPTDTTVVTIAGVTYQVLTGCKPHDCGDNNALVLYAPASGVLYGKLLVKNVPSLIGMPAAPVALELDRLWRAEWRQGQ